MFLLHTTGGKLGTGIKRVQAALVVLMLAVLGFLGTQPASATETSPVPGATDSPTPQPTPTFPEIVLPPVLEPAPSPSPLEPEVPPAPVQPPVEPAPAPVIAPTPEPAAPPVVEPVVPIIPAQPTSVFPLDTGGQGYVVEPELPAEATASAPAEPTPTATPTPTKTAAPPVVSADITGPLKVALAPVAENNPIVQGLTVLVLILLGLAYFRALRSKGIRGPRLDGK